MLLARNFCYYCYIENYVNVNTETGNPIKGLHAIGKPMGSACNLNCEYCFYLEKQALFQTNEDFRMSKKVLELFIKNYIESQPTPIVEFVWQGGEPTLRGVDFFRKVIELQTLYKKSKKITNSLQTNGTLLTDEWCLFLKENNFLVGISLDGPKELHDRYRLDKNGKGTFDKVMHGLRLLQKHGVEYNVMASVAKETADRPLDVYHFFKQEGIEFLQFTPIVERTPDQKALSHGLSFAMPSALDKQETNTEITSWTVDSKKYGDFLVAIFDEWVRQDVGKTFVMNFEWALNAALGSNSPVCIFARQCGRSVVVEHNGDVYACDHYVYPEYHLGNHLKDSLAQMVDFSCMEGFGPHKETSLTRWCQECDVLRACWGGCPKHRFSTSPYGEPGLHYLCPGYKKFFSHISKYMHGFRTLMEFNIDPKHIMQAIDHPLIIPASENSGNREVVLWIR